MIFVGFYKENMKNEENAKTKKKRGQIMKIYPFTLYSLRVPGPMGPGPMGPGPWARGPWALDPGPMGPGPWPRGPSRK